MLKQSAPGLCGIISSNDRRLSEIDLGFEIGSGISIVKRFFQFNSSFLVEIEQGQVEGLHAFLTTFCHSHLDFVNVAFQNQFGNVWSINQDFDGSTTFSINT